MPLTPASYYTDLGYGQGLTSGANAGRSNTSGVFNDLGTLPGLTQNPYQFVDDEFQQAQSAIAAKAAVADTPASADFRAALAAGATPAAGTEGLYEGLLDPLTGKAKAAVKLRGTAFKAGTPEILGRPARKMMTDPVEIETYRIGRQAEQEGAAGRAEARNRGNTILAGYDQNIANNRGMSDRILAQNVGYGDSMRRMLDNDFASRLAKSNQSAIRRGLGNTTVRDSLNRGVTSDYDLSRMQLGDQLTQRNIGLTTDAMNRENQATNARLGFLSGIENDYPDSADVANYYQQAQATKKGVSGQQKQSSSGNILSQGLGLVGKLFGGLFG